MRWIPLEIIQNLYFSIRCLIYVFNTIDVDGLTTTQDYWLSFPVTLWVSYKEDFWRNQSSAKITNVKF